MFTPLTRNDSLYDIDFSRGAGLLVNKPPGMTSFDVVHKIRKAINIQKIGHTGTLDPAATGLLILLTGKATRSQNGFMGMDKEYLATILLGVETTTWDMDGEVTRRNDIPTVNQGDIEDLLNRRFTGSFLQIPPAFSAIKINGVPSYRRARRGQNVTIEARPVYVHSNRLEEWSPPELKLRVHCSSGFYVRSLAHDIGDALTCGGTLQHLTRTAIGSYRLEDAFQLDILLDELKNAISA